MTKIEEIYEGFLLPFMEEHGIEDTTENRLWALEAASEGMREVPGFDAILYNAAVSSEIFKLQLKLKFPDTFEKLGL